MDLPSLKPMARCRTAGADARAGHVEPVRGRGPGIVTRWRTAVGLVALGLLIGVAGCLPTTVDRDSELRVAVSIPPQRWLAEQLGGEGLRVMVLVGPGESPHTYQPTDAQISRLMSSSVYFRMGVAFENGPWFKAIQSARGLRVVDLREGIERLDMEPCDEHEGHEHAGHEHEGQSQQGHAHDDHDHDHDHAEHANASGARNDSDHHEARYIDTCCSEDGKDPHIWLSPQRLKRQAKTMADALAEVDPAHKAEYLQRLGKLEAELDDLDRQIHKLLDPLRGKPFFVFHPAWGYFAHDYGLRQMAIEIEGKEPSDHQLTELQKQAREEQVKVVLVQPQISGRGARAVASATGARLEVVDPLAADVPKSLLQMARILAQGDK